MRDGSAFEHPTLAHPIPVSECSSLLPTPDAYEAKRGGAQHPEKRRAGGHSPYLASVVEWTLLPTPTASSYGSNQSDSPGAAVRPSLDGIARLLPTPRHTDHHDSLTAPASRAHVEARNGTLPETIGYQLMPTPRASDAEKGGPNQRGSRGDLTLTSAAHRTGHLMSPQYDAGNTSQDDTLPGL